MQVTVTISDEVVREAGYRRMGVVEYVEALIDQGKQVQARPAVFSAMERIRALRETTTVEGHALEAHVAEGHATGGHAAEAK
jgi:hypothetical protein